jgi:hypothetical protein
MNLVARYFMKRSLIWWYVGVLAFHVLFLFVVIPRLGDPLTRFYNQNKSPDGYDILAKNLVEGNGYRFYPETASTLMREPGYPVLLAGVFYVFGDSFTAVKVTNLLLAFATAFLIGRLASRITQNAIVIVGAPLLFLLHPATLIAESRGGVEILFTLLIVLFVLLMYRANAGGKLRQYAISGAVLGLTVLVKSTPLLFPLALFAYLVVFERRRMATRAICQNIGLMILTMFMVLSPWILRNYSLTGRFVPTASVLGVSAHAGQYIGMHLSRDRSWAFLDREAARERSAIARQLGYSFRDGYYQVFYSSNDELAFSNELLKRVIGEYRRSPLLFAKIAGLNLLNFWFAGKTWKSTMIDVAIQFPFLLLATAGAVLSVRRNGPNRIGPIVLFIVYLVAVSMPILAQARYSMPTIPFLAILACIPVTADLSRVRRNDAAARASRATLAVV